MLRVLLALLLLAPLASAAGGELIIGQASVIDGDTIEIHGERIRLFGVDAPESRQLCGRVDGTPYRCGQIAALALADRIGRAAVTCEPRGRDRWRRIIAVCSANGEDMGRWMARSGHALAFLKYSETYLPDERAAQDARSGVWQGQFVEPWKWRKGAR